MAKAKKNHLVSDVTDDEATGLHSVDAPDEAPELTREQKLALFDAYFSADSSVTEAEGIVEHQKTVRSEAVRAIVEALGNKGPWSVNGVRLAVTVRGDKYHMTKEADARLTL